MSWGDSMKNILLIDHALNTHIALKNIFQEYSIEILDANTARDAKRLLNEFDSIKLIIIDTNSSNFDGFQFIEDIRTHYTNIPIIILTSSNNRSDFVRGIKSGVDDYILKPFNNAELVNRVFRQLNYDRKIVKETFDENNITVDSIIEKEIVKSKKGNYPLIIMGIHFYAITDRDMSNAYANIAGYYFDVINSVLFDTDIFIQYGDQFFFGILPFCSQENFSIVEEKIRLTIRKNSDKKFGSFNIKWGIETVLFPNVLYDNTSVGKVIEDMKESLKKNIKYKHANIKIDEDEGED